ncbi:peptide transporter family 1 [Drosophila guanche]|uniref:Blast:Peptide transporter family 1 n=1 Tax=Drosophila guanche TaxID=7266 RepID=A0A3B0K2F5_DROGU|nr:peptide transporter family 1 [Drosophila guanche]SPP88475.1 blast:Peptide transporter family 1 [Drosophila guanche]
MFRATEIGSEETLPALAELTQASYEPEGRDIEWGAWGQSQNSERKLLKSRQRSSLPNYGFAPPPIRMEYRYPRAVYFILATKFFEAFAANGIRTILALYLRDDLNFTESFSTVVLHIFNFFGQFCPIIGAVLADSYMGNVRTISAFCFLYAFGWLLLTMTSLPSMEVPIILLVSIALLFLAVGNGSIRACITSLGALQFKMPEQAVHLSEYFSFYYFVYYFGIFLSKILPPLVRTNTQCFDKAECYPAVFGTLESAFLMAWLIFLIGKCFYKTEKLADDNILFKFCGCIKTALVTKWRRRKSNKRSSYWLHNAIGVYDEGFVNDVSKVLRISKLFLPLPFYFALLAQQDSSWTFQAAMMNTTVLGVVIQPDQAKAAGPIFLFMLIPLWQYVTVPLLRRYFNWELSPLNSVTVGGICSAGSFFCAGALQQEIMNAPIQTINISWQLPQFFLLMLGELLLSIPGLQFAFTQAPASMKSVVTATWFLNNAFGNLIVVVVTELGLLSSQMAEYFFYAVIMLVCIIIFALLAYDYTLQERKGGLYLRGCLDGSDSDELDIPSTSRSDSI